MADNNPYDDLVQDTTGGGGSGGGSGGGGSQSPLQNSQYDASPEEQTANVYALNDIFGKVPDYWALNAPDTVMHITLPENQVYQQASIQALQYLQLIYGPQVTPTLQAALLQDPDQREYAFSVLKQIAQKDVGSFYENLSDDTNHQAGTRADLFAKEQAVDAELMSRVIADPGMLDTLAPGTRAKVIEQARMAGETLAPAGDAGKQFYLISGQTASQNYDVFMNEQERAALEQVLQQASKGLDVAPGQRGTPAAAAAKKSQALIGVAEVQNAGGPNPTIILDEAWAQARPVRAAAVMDYLRTQLPDVAFRVGEKGLVGKVLDVLGKTVDVVSAVPGAAVSGVGEIAEEYLWDKTVYNDDDRARMAQEAERLQKRLEDGEVKSEDWDDTLRTIQHLKDNAEVNINYDFGEAIDLNLHPREAGFGFAENFVDSVDLLPGDPGYDAAYAISGLVANLVFDPLNYILPGIGGAKAARHTVAGAAEAVGKFDVTLDTFRTMGNVQDASRVAAKSVEGILPAAPKAVEEVIGKGRYVIFKAVDEDLEAVLKARGYQVGKATMNGEDAYLVPKVTLEEGIHIAQEAGLPSFLSTEGLVNVGTRRVREVEKVVTNGKGATDTASFGGRSWGYKLARSETKLRPPRIAGGYTKNFFYQRMVKTPEEYLATKPAQEAIHRLWVTRQAVGRERFLARVQRLFNVDPRTARVMANARNEDDLHMALQAAMTGNMASAYNETRNLGRLNAAVDRLNEYDRLRAVGAGELSGDLAITRLGGDRVRIQGWHGHRSNQDFLAVPDTEQGFGGTFHFGTREAAEDRSSTVHLLEADATPVQIEGKFLGVDEPLTEVDNTILEAGSVEEAVNTDLIGMPGASDEVLAGIAAGPEPWKASAEWLKENALSPVIRELHAEADVRGITVPELLREKGYSGYVYTNDIEDPGSLSVATFGKQGVSRITEDPRLPALEATRADDVAEISFLRSMQSGRDFNIGLRDLPNSRQWRQFMGKENRGVVGRGLVSMAEFAERFPGNLIGMGPKRVAQFLQTPEGRIAEKSAKQASIGLGRWFHPHGAGGRVHFPYVALPGDELADAVVESADNLRNIMRTFALPKERAEEIVGKFMDLKNERQGFEWTKGFWESIADDSPLLSATGREQIRDIWPDLYSERSPGLISNGKAGEFWSTEPTLYRTTVDETGELGKSGVPAFTADMLHSIKLPDLDTVLELISFNRRMLRNWSKAGGMRQPIAKGVMEGQRMWQAFARFWKTAVLLGKMPFSLPARIIGEEWVRIAAYDEASIINHPISWFKAARNADEFALMAESNAMHLGLLGEQFMTRMRKVRPGRQVITLGHDAPDLYARAASVKVAKLAKSPEVSRFYIGKKPAEALAAMESGEGLARGSGDLLGLWDEIIDPKGIKSRQEVVGRIQREINQLAGGNDKVLAAMKNGRMTNEAGDVVEAGTEEFATELERMLSTGEWQPQAKQIPAAAHDWEWVDPKTGLAEFRDKAFHFFYTKPDVALARRPLYRSIANREYQRLTSLGWKPEKAREAAHAYGARRVADMLYRIGETSAAHHWLRNIAPFFPAFQELTNTWLIRIPKAMGGGFWLPGAVRLTRKADVFFDFFKQMGWVEKDARGEWTVPIPFLGTLVGALTGSPVPIRARASLSSFAGVLPDPFSGIKGLLPGLGAPSSAILSEASERWDGVVDTFADYLMPFGREVSLGPSAVDRLMMAAGIEPPWTFGSPDYQKSLKAYAVDDAIRMEIAKSKPPKQEEGEKDATFRKRYTQWSEGILERAERRASLMFAVRGLSSMVLPFSATYETDYDTEMEKIWGNLSTFPGGGDTVVGPFIDAFKAAHPDAVWYVNGKTISLKDDRDFSRTDSFIQEWTDQKRHVLTPRQYLRWTVGMQSFSVYMNKLNRAYEALGSTPAEVLLHGYEKDMTVDRLKQEWQDYLDWTDEITPENETSFKELFEEWQEARDKQPGTDITKEQENILEVKRGLAELSHIFTDGGVRNSTYKATQGTLSENLGELNFPASSPTGKAISWWYENVGRPYGDEISKLYDQLDVTEDPNAKAPIYAEIRRLANSQKPQTYKGMKMPTPEEVYFGNLSPDEKTAKRLDWATLPVEWLTNFQMEQIGVTVTPKMTDLATFINQDEARFDLLVAQNGLHQASNDYQALRRAFDMRALEKAESLGLRNQFALMKAPVYKRIDHFFKDEFDSTSWNQVVRMADQGTTAIANAADGNKGNTEEAVQQWLVQQVRRIRANDDKFNDIMKRLEVVYAPKGEERATPDLLVLKLFTDYYGDSAPASLYV